jgi:hypothetical protein
MVTVNNCTLSARSAGVRVGFDQGETRDCVFNGLVIHSNRGINVNVRGEGSVENISFSNILIQTQLFTGHWWGKAEPIQVSAMPWNPQAKRLGHIRHIIFRNIQAEGESGILIYGCEQSRIQDVIIEGLSLRIHSSPLHASYGGNFDLRSTDQLSTALFQHDIPGLYGCYFDGLTLRDVHLTWQGELPEYFTHGLHCQHFRDLTIRDFRAGPAHAGKGQAILLEDGEGISIGGETPRWAAG